MMWQQFIQVYIIILVVVSIVGIFRYKLFDTATKLIFTYIIITSFSESLAFYTSLVYGNNLLIYHIYCPIQLVFIAIYFNTVISFFRRYNIGYIIGGTGVVISVINSLFFQSPKTTFNSYFLITEAILIIGMTLCYFYDYLNSDQTVIKIINPHFIIACLLLTFWSFTFFHWLSWIAMPEALKENIFWIRYMNWSINMITYTGFGIVFLLYRKLKPIEQ